MIIDNGLERPIMKITVNTEIQGEATCFSNLGCIIKTMEEFNQNL